VTVPPLVDAALFRAAHAQLEENRSRARQGRRRPGYLLQGLIRCARCGYAYYGKTIRQFGAGRQMKDFIYYRCGGSDGYRFGGEAICNNKQVQGEFLETTVFHLLGGHAQVDRFCLNGIRHVAGRKHGINREQAAETINVLQ